MKKLIFLLASAGLLLTACIAEDSGMQEQIGEAVIIGATYEAPEAEPGTRSIIENGGAFKWSALDSFNAYSTGTTTESFEANVFEIYDYGDDEHRASASFIGYGIPGRIKDVAVCPATLKPTWAAASQTLKVTYPSEITWVKGEADPYMVARGFEVGAKNLSFKNLGGIIKLTINEIPVTASKVAVTIWGGRITGEFTVGQTTESSTTYWVVNDDVTDSSTPSTVTFTFTASDVDPEGMTFYVPVPVMEYSKIGFSVLNSNNEPLFSFASSEKTRTVARKQIVSFPSITFVEGGGEGSFSNVITTDSGQTGTVTLPSTENDVYVLMNSTAGEITLVPGSEDPKEVYITVLKDATVNSLNVNLPNSTVYINGEANSNLGTVNSTTSPTTLKILKSPLTIGTATINKGNANIEGTVNSIVVASGATSGDQDKPQVQIFVSKDAALQTVTLNAQTDVVVEQPKDQIAVEATENKVYVIVNAEGSTATAQNGGDIYVTANANCTVTANDVEKTDPDNKSTAKVENNSGGTIETITEGDGVIETGAQVVKAKIGNVEYYTLDGSEGAFANVKDGETINLLVSVTLDQNPFDVALENKAVTLDLGGNTLFGRTNLKSGSLTVQNGAIVCEDGQPLNVYGKETSAQNYSVLTVASNVTVSGKYGVCMFGPTAGSKPGYGAVANIAGKINAKNPVFVSGNLGNNIAEDMNNVVNINSGAVLTSTTDVAVALNGWATVKVKSGATINGSTGIAVKRGVLNVEDGATVTANGEWTTPPAANNNGTEPTGAAVSMTPTYSQYGAMAVNITGGTFSATGTGSEALYKSDGTYQSDATFTVTGGTFSSDPTAYVAPGYVANENTDGTWTVEPVPAVAKIGDVTYTTLADAFTATQDGQTIVVIRDIDLPATIQVDKTVTLDLNGKTIFNTADLWAGGNWSFFSVIGNGNLTVTGEGTIDAKENDCYTFDVKNGGVLTIKNGTFTGNISCVYLVSNDANTVCNIEGGHFSIKQLDKADPYHLLLNCLDADYTAGRTNFVVTGGSFEHFNPAASTSEPGSPVSFVPGGYYATEENDTWTVLEETNVAQIGETKYATLAEAVEAATDGQTITLLKNVTQDSGIQFDKANATVKFDLNGNTFTVNTGSNVNNRAIRIDNGTLEVYGGTIVAAGSGTNKDNGSGCYGAFRVEKDGVLNAHDLSLSNARPWGLNVKVLGGEATLTNVNITSSYGGGIEVSEEDLDAQHTKPGVATLTNCHFTQTGYNDWCSTPLSVSGGSTLIVNSGTYETTTSYGLYVFSSGGIINVKGGTFSATGDKPVIIAAIDTQTYPQYTGGLTIEGGNFTGSYSITSPAFMSITGGTFNVDPSAYVAPGYAAQENAGIWTIVEAPIYAGGDSGNTLAEAVALVKAANGGIIKLLGDVEVSSYIRVEAPTVLDLNGFNVNASSPLFDYVTADLTIRDSGENGTMNVNVGSSSYGIRSYTSGVKIKLEGGTLSAYCTPSWGGNVMAVQVSSGATFEMTGGKIIVPSTSTANNNYCLVVGDSNSSAVISGGDIIAEASGANYTINNSGTVNISGGFVSGKSSTYNYPYKYPYVLYGNGTYNISGGRIKAIGIENWGQSAHFFDSGTHASITGGFFGGVDIEDSNSRAEVSSRVASGYQLVNLSSSDPEYVDGYRYKVVAQ